jgi:hypothetical protein
VTRAGLSRRRGGRAGGGLLVLPLVVIALVASIVGLMGIG